MDSERRGQTSCLRQRKEKMSQRNMKTESRDGERYSCKSTLGVRLTLGIKLTLSVDLTSGVRLTSGVDSTLNDKLTQGVPEGHEDREPRGRAVLLYFNPAPRVNPSLEVNPTPTVNPTGVPRP